MTKKPSTSKPHTFTPVDAPPAPTAGRTGGTYIPLFEACRKNPGQWFQVNGRKFTSVADNIKKGKVKGSSPGEFEVVTRNTFKGKGDIFIRYIGQHSDEPQP